MKSMLNRQRQQWQRNDSPVAVPRLIVDGVEVTDNDLWVWLQIPDGSTQLKEDDELADETFSTAEALRALVPSDGEYHIKVLWAAADDSDYRSSWERFRSTRAPRIEDYVGLGAHRIRLNADSGRVRRRVVLLGVRWPQSTSASDAGKEAARHLRGQRATYRDARQRLQAAQRKIDSWIERAANSSLQATPAPASLIAWSYAREMRRGGLVQVPDHEEFSGSQLVNLLHGTIDPSEDPNYVVVTDARTGQRRYVTIVVPSVNGFPATELEIPGGEWLEMLAEITGVEASVRGVQHSQQNSLHMIKDAQRVAASQDREAAEQDVAAPPDVVTASAVLTERQREVSHRHDVLTTNHCRWIVDAESPEALDEKVAELQNLYTGVVELTVPPYVQDLLWRELMPGDTVRVPEFAEMMPMRTLAGSWFHGGSAIGDATGPYLGLNLGSSPGPVQIHPTSRLADHTHDTTTITYSGMSGMAKTTSVTMTLLGILADGAWAALVDAKGDMGGIRPVAQQLLGIPVQTVDLMDPASSGMMDPLRFAANTDEARSLALEALLNTLSPEDRQRSETVLEQAIDEVLTRPRELWTSQAVIATLVATPEENPRAADAHAIGDTLRTRAQLPQIRPVLGPLADEAEPLLGHRGLVYMDLSGLDLPIGEPDPANWSIPQRVSVAAWRMTMAYPLHQSRHQQRIPKFVALTELHLLTGQEEGRAYVGRIARLGRALKFGQLLDSQSAGDMVQIPGLLDQVLMSFAFRADSDAEQRAQAQLLKRPDPGPRLRAAQSGLGRGQAVVRDRRNRLGIMEFDRLTSWIAETLDTAPPADDDDGFAAYDAPVHASGNGQVQS